LWLEPFQYAQDGGAEDNDDDVDDDLQPAKRFKTVPPDFEAKSQVFADQIQFNHNLKLKLERECETKDGGGWWFEKWFGTLMLCVRCATDPCHRVNLLIMCSCYT